jgi:hypothetical protein
MQEQSSNTPPAVKQYNKQDSCIVAISYKMGWGSKRKANLFNFIIGVFGELNSKLTEHEIKYKKYSALFKVMSTEQKDKIIKQLDMIKKNKNKNLRENQNEKLF